MYVYILPKTWEIQVQRPTHTEMESKGNIIKSTTYHKRKLDQVYGL